MRKLLSMMLAVVFLLTTTALQVVAEAPESEALPEAAETIEIEEEASDEEVLLPETDEEMPAADEEVPDEAPAPAYAYATVVTDASRVLGTDLALPEGAVVLATGMEDGLEKVAFYTSDGMVEGLMDPSDLIEMDEEAQNAYVDALLDSETLVLYADDLDWPLGLTDVLFAALTEADEDTAADSEQAALADVLVEALELSCDTLQLNVGDTATIVPTFTPADATNQGLTWKTGNKNVATVSSSGVVTAVAPGQVTISATAKDGSGVKTLIKFSVIAQADVLITSIKLTAEASRIEAGTTMTLGCTIEPEDASIQTLTWKSSDTSVATVSSSGVVKGVAPGSVTISATAQDGSNVKTTVKLNVTPEGGGTLVELIKVTGSKTVAVGDTITLSAVVTPDDADIKDVTWKSSKTSIASINQTGLVTGKAPGTVTISATAKDGSGSKGIIKVTVTESVPADVLSASLVGTATVDAPATFSVVTEEAAGTLALFTSGGVRVGLWKAADNSVVEGGNRVWTVSYAFSGTGNKSMVFKASQAGSNYGETVSVTVPVKTYPNVKSAVAASASVETGADASFTVVTAYNAQYLEMFDESGALLDCWERAGNATTSGTLSTWKVTHAFADAGSVTVTFKASADRTNYGSKTQNVALTVTEAGAAVLATKIVLSADSKQVDVGQTLRLTATFTPADTTDQSVTWKSSNTKVATVSADGVVTGVAAGSVSVSATAKDGSGAKGIIKLTVVASDVPVTAIALSGGETVEKGETLQLTATVTPADATDATVAWSSSDESVLTVTASGLVTGVAAGSATVTATANDGSGITASVTVSVTVAATAIAVSGAETDLDAWPMDIGDTVQLTAAVSPEDCTDASVTWTSADEAVATVSDAGLVTAVSAGLATITATTANGLTATVDVQVYDLTVVRTFMATLNIDEGALESYTGQTVWALAQSTTADLAALDFTDGDFIWHFTDDVSGSIVAKYTGSAAEVTVPDAFLNVTVLEIGASAFEANTALTTIHLPDKITVIREAAFRNCKNLSSMD